jgi:hypothetical protein
MAPQHQQTAADFDVPEDRRWQEIFWTVQRISWALMGLFILGAILGVTGSGGPLSTATVTTPTGGVDYPAVTRWESGEEIVFRIPPGTPREVQLTLSPEFDRVFAVDSIAPQPSSSAATASGHRYTFDIEGAGEKHIVFNVTSGKPAVARRVSARIDDGPPARLTVTVLP